MIVTLIDYGAGNVTSVERALQRLGAASQGSSSPECIAKAEALLLPGVGHYATLIRALDERALRAPLLGAIQRGVPFLGVCLGLQALYETSEEAPELAGLHILSGSVRSCQHVNTRTTQCISHVFASRRPQPGRAGAVTLQRLTSLPRVPATSASGREAHRIRR